MPHLFLQQSTLSAPRTSAWWQQETLEPVADHQQSGFRHMPVSQLSEQRQQLTLGWVRNATAFATWSSRIAAAGDACCSCAAGAAALSTGSSAGWLAIAGSAMLHFDKGVYRAHAQAQVQHTSGVM
jgi:hypothetical protein